ncbi:MAG: sensor histidine kinase, partial [Solirubrobacteraceae bacterium]
MSEEEPVTLAELRSVDLFDSLDDAELSEWVPLARARHVSPGEIVAEQGEEPPGLQLLLEGRTQAFILAQGR